MLQRSKMCEAIHGDAGPLNVRLNGNSILADTVQGKLTAFEVAESNQETQQWFMLSVPAVFIQSRQAIQAHHSAFPSE